MTDRNSAAILPVLSALEALDTKSAANLVDALHATIDLLWTLHGDGIGALWAEQETARLMQSTEPLCSEP